MLFSACCIEDTEIPNIATGTRTPNIAILLVGMRGIHSIIVEQSITAQVAPHDMCILTTANASSKYLMAAW